MKLTHTIIAFLLVGMLATTAAAAQHQGELPDQVNEQDQVQTQAQEQMPNQTQDVETNETEGNATEKPEEAEGKSAQFDSRLKVAIDTLDALTEIAPNEEAENGLQTALEQLKSVQENTETDSLGDDSPENESEEAENETGTEEAENKSEEAEQGGPENANRGGSEQARQNRPSFVNQIVGGLFG